MKRVMVAMIAVAILWGTGIVVRTSSELPPPVEIYLVGSDGTVARVIGSTLYVGPEQRLEAHLGAPILQVLETPEDGLLVLTSEALYLLRSQDNRWSHVSEVLLERVPERLEVWDGYVWGVRDGVLWRVFRVAE
jgi:hypothetical protein